MNVVEILQTTIYIDKVYQDWWSLVNLKELCHKIHGNSNSEYCHQIVWNKKNNRSKKLQNTKEVTDGQTAPAVSESLLV